MTKSFVGIFLLLSLTARAEANKCVQIYYDSVPSVSPTFYFGRSHVTFVQNLLGNFHNVQQYVIPIEKYKSGQLERCESSI